MINLTLQRNTIADDIDLLVRRISNPGNAQKRSIADAIRQQFQANFTRQGSGAGRWAPLARMTVLQRIEQGYAGSSPILVRSGRYRASFVQRGNSDHYESIASTGTGLVIEVGSNDDRGPELELGTRIMPARPVTLLDEQQEDRIADTIDFMFRQIEQGLGIR